MARQESDRDDLFAELAALSPRAELKSADREQAVYAGRRESTGGWSLFLTPDLVYHFDSHGRLRRAYVAGLLYRTQGHTLARLRRQRSATRTTLLRHDFNPEELTSFLDDMRTAIGTFASELRAGRVQVLRAAPDEVDIVPLLHSALQNVLHAKAPLAPTLGVSD